MLSYISRIIVGFILILLPLIAVTSDPMGRQVFLGGTNVQFPINSLHKYRHGMELREWTRVKVRITNQPIGGTWRYQIYAMNDPVEGETFGNILDLDYLQIEIKLLNTTFEAGNISVETNPIPLSATPYEFVSGLGSGEFELLVSYKLGTNPLKPLMGEMPDYYFIDLEFHLQLDETP